MGQFNNKSYEGVSSHVFYEQVVRREDNSDKGKPIKVSHGPTKTIVYPTNPMYKIIKWYGKY
jgi:hypothetical protein